MYIQFIWILSGCILELSGFYPDELPIYLVLIKSLSVFHNDPSCVALHGILLGVRRNRILVSSSPGVYPEIARILSGVYLGFICMPPGPYLDLMQFTQGQHKHF